MTPALWRLDHYWPLRRFARQTETIMARYRVTAGEDFYSWLADFRTELRLESPRPRAQ